MINRAVSFFVGFLVVFGVFGCSSEISVEPGVPVCLTATTQTEAMDICEDVLVAMHFEIEKFDVDKEYIKTRPLRGAQFFEFWRSDNVGAKNDGQSNLHSVLRTIELQLDESQGQYCVKCSSQTRRLSIEEAKLSSSTISRGIFSGGSKTFQKLRPKNENLEWIDMGSDTELEQRILGRILFKDENR